MKQLLRVLACLFLATCITWLLLPRCELYPEGVTWSRVMLDREGAVMHLTLAGDGRYRLKTPLAEIHGM